MKRTCVLFKLICIAAVAFLSTAAFTYAFWKDEITGSSLQQALQFYVGNYTDPDGNQGNYDDDPLQNIPSYVPDSYVETLEQIRQSLQGQSIAEDEIVSIIQALVDKVIHIFHNDPSHNLHLSERVDGIFDDNPVGRDEFLIYLSADNEVIVVHIGANVSDFWLPKNPQELENALTLDWLGVQLISTMWVEKKVYSAAHVPIEYNRELFVPIFHSLDPPSRRREAWFKLSPDLEFDSQNTRYPFGYVTKVGDQYFTPRSSSVWTGNGSNTPSLTNNAWSAVNLWSGGTISQGTIVMTKEGETIHFWRAIETTSTEPSEANARAGFWQEHRYVWTGQMSHNEVSKSYYFPHNNYGGGEIVVYGIDAFMNYRYFIATTDISCDTPPFEINPDGSVGARNPLWDEWT